MLLRQQREVQLPQVKDGQDNCGFVKDYLHPEVSDEELEARRRGMEGNDASKRKGLFGRYACLVNTARSGATLSRVEKRV